jgi:RHS repeat-associated protein
LGRRIEKISPTTTSIFAYDGDNLVETVNASGGLVAHYTQGSRVDEPLAMQRGSTTDYYEQDGLGSVTSLTGTNGSVVQSYTYDSFGNTTNSSGSLTNFFRYTGREYDTETGLYFLRMRYFDPLTGRFVSEDPIRWWGGQNDYYAYVEDSPTNYVDPHGLTVTVVGDGSGNYQQAINYLNGDPGMAGIINDLNGSSTNYNVIINNNDDDSYDPGTHTIHWDPHSALCDSGCKQSPALGLGHEMAHADGPWYSGLLAWIPWPGYNNLEERRVITGPERKAAKNLGECTRSDHGGTPYLVPTPTSR